MTRLQSWLARQATEPGMSMIAWLTLVSGIFGLIKFGPRDPINLLLPDWLAFVVFVMYSLAGLFILVGLAQGKAKIEAPGLVFLIAVTFVQLIGYLDFVGLDQRVMRAFVFYILVSIFAYVRLRVVVRGDEIIRVKGGHEGDISHP